MVCSTLDDPLVLRELRYTLVLLAETAYTSSRKGKPHSIVIDSSGRFGIYNTVIDAAIKFASYLVWKVIIKLLSVHVHCKTSDGVITHLGMKVSSKGLAMAPNKWSELSRLPELASAVNISSWDFLLIKIDAPCFRPGHV